MTSREMELLASEFDEPASSRSYRKRPAPSRSATQRRSAVQFSRQRRTPGIPLGIHARGGRRSTYRSLSRGKIRAASGAPQLAAALDTAHAISPSNTTAPGPV